MVSDLTSLITEHPTRDHINPKFIVMEGLDGSGKSTQINMLYHRLLENGRRVHMTAEPTNSSTGGLIRDALSNNYVRKPAELAALFLADRITHNVNPVWGIDKILSDGIDVICDRYYYSSFAYQGLEADLNWILDMNLNCPQIRKPDLCIFLDINDRKCKQRMNENRAHLEIFEENEEQLHQIRTKFFEVFQLIGVSENIVIVDADRPAELVANDIYQHVMNLG